MALRRRDGLDNDVWGLCGESSEDPSGVEPPAAFGAEDLIPIDVAGPELRRGQFRYELFGTTSRPSRRYGSEVNRANPGKMHQVNWVRIELHPEPVFLGFPTPNPLLDGPQESEGARGHRGQWQAQ